MPEPTTPPPDSAPAHPPTPPALPPTRFAFVPMPAGSGPGAALGALLKRPGSLIYQLHQPRSGPLLGALLAATLACLGLYGLVIGSFSGGVQWWAAPAKLVGGTLLSAVICLPSLYIFTCLSGAEVRLRPLCGVLLATLCLNALLLTGFAPVAWVFSQSTDSVAFMGTLHLFFWFVSMLFALRLLSAQMDFVGSAEPGYLRLWFFIFLLVCLQMSTALRPFVGRSNTFLPTEKRFFLSHWGSSLSEEPKPTPHP